MARRQKSKEQFLKRQREENAAKRKAAAVAGSAELNKAAAENNAAAGENNAADDASPPKYYTITDPASETTEKATTEKATSNTNIETEKKAASSATDANAATTDASDTAPTTTDKKEKANPLKQIAIHATNSNNNDNDNGGSKLLDIYTYHRGRVGQEPRHPQTGELLCDSDPVDTNHSWTPPKTMVKVTIKFPLGDLDEEEYDDSDLEEDDNVGEGGKGDNNESKGLVAVGKLHRSESVGSEVRASRSRASRGSSGTYSTVNQQQTTNTQQYQNQQQPSSSKSLPHFIETIQWDLTSPHQPTPEEYACTIASEFGLTFPQTMDLKESIEFQLNNFLRTQPQFFAPIAVLDPYASERPDSHFGPSEGYCGPVLNATAVAVGGGDKPSTVIRRSNSTASGASRRSTGGGGGGGSRSSSQPRGQIKPDRRGINVVPKDQVPMAASDTYSLEVCNRAKARSQHMVKECQKRGEATLEIVVNEVCHICHNRKEMGLTFHCGRHTYCDFHCASRLSFRANEYDKATPLCVPIDYCPVCCLFCTCAKCTRRLEDVAGKLKTQCEKQNCGVDAVVMDNLYDLCSNKLKGDRDTKPKAASSRASSGGDGTGGASSKKKSSKKVKIDVNATLLDVAARGLTGGGSKRGRSSDAGDNEDTYIPRQSTSRSTRSSPIEPPLPSTSSGPKKKRKFEPAAFVPVLKIPPSEFPKEMYITEDLDPSGPDDLNQIFTPDGSFQVDDTQGGSKKQKKYQNVIEIAAEGHFFQCAVCGMDNGDERICCKKCPRSYHKKCFEDQCSAEVASGGGGGAKDSSSGEPQKKRECKRCEYDQQIRKGEEIDSGVPATDKKIQKAYDQYREKSKCWAYTCMILSEILRVLKKLNSYDYGDIFASPVDTQLVPDYLHTISKPMDYGTIISKLEKGGYSPSSDSSSNDDGEKMDAMEDIILYALMDIVQVHHNCFLFNPKGSMFYRAAAVQDSKWNAYFNAFKDRLPDGVQASLAKFQKSCKKERQKTGQSRTFQTNKPDSRRGRALAVFDPDTKRIVKQYSTKASARTAVLMLQHAGYACEWELTESNTKHRMEGAEDPSKPLFGYQWVPTEKLKSGNFKVKPYFRNDDLVSPTPNNIVIFKEDTVSGDHHVRGFESEESAYEDWLSDKSRSFTARVDQDGGRAESLSDFVKNYLDGDESINGIVWNRVELDNKGTSVPKSPGKLVMEEEHAAVSQRKL